MSPSSARSLCDRVRFALRRHWTQQLIDCDSSEDQQPLFLQLIAVCSRSELAHALTRWRRSYLSLAVEQRRRAQAAARVPPSNQSASASTPAPPRTDDRAPSRCSLLPRRTRVMPLPAQTSIALPIIPPATNSASPELGTSSHQHQQHSLHPIEVCSIICSACIASLQSDLPVLCAILCRRRRESQTVSPVSAPVVEVPSDADATAEFGGLDWTSSDLSQSDLESLFASTYLQPSTTALMSGFAQLKQRSVLEPHDSLSLWVMLQWFRSHAAALILRLESPVSLLNRLITVSSPFTELLLEQPCFASISSIDLCLSHPLSHMRHYIDSLTMESLDRSPSPRPSAVRKSPSHISPHSVLASAPNASIATTATTATINSNTPTTTTTTTAIITSSIHTLPPRSKSISSSTKFVSDSQLLHMITQLGDLHQPLPQEIEFLDPLVKLSDFDVKKLCSTGFHASTPRHTTILIQSNRSWLSGRSLSIPNHSARSRLLPRTLTFIELESMLLPHTVQQSFMTLPPTTPPSSSTTPSSTISQRWLSLRVAPPAWSSPFPVPTTIVPLITDAFHLLETLEAFHLSQLRAHSSAPSSRRSSRRDTPPSVFCSLASYWVKCINSICLNLQPKLLEDVCIALNAIVVCQSTLEQMRACGLIDSIPTSCNDTSTRLKTQVVHGFVDRFRGTISTNATQILNPVWQRKRDLPPNLRQPHRPSSLCAGALLLVDGWSHDLSPLLLPPLHQELIQHISVECYHLIWAQLLASTPSRYWWGQWRLDVCVLMHAAFHSEHPAEDLLLMAILMFICDVTSAQALQLVENVVTLRRLPIVDSTQSESSNNQPVFEWLRSHMTEFLSKNANLFDSTVQVFSPQCLEQLPPPEIMQRIASNSLASHLLICLGKRHQALTDDFPPIEDAEMAVCDEINRMARSLV